MAGRGREDARADPDGDLREATDGRGGAEPAVLRGESRSATPGRQGRGVVGPNPDADRDEPAAPGDAGRAGMVRGVGRRTLPGAPAPPPGVGGRVAGTLTGEPTQAPGCHGRHVRPDPPRTPGHGRGRVVEVRAGRGRVRADRPAVDEGGTPGNAAR